jgi:hypothetical protein
MEDGPHILGRTASTGLQDFLQNILKEKDDNVVTPKPNEENTKKVVKQAGVLGLLKVLKEAGEDREDIRLFGKVKRYCHNDKCTNFGICQLLRPKAHHKCKYEGKGCSKPLFRHPASMQWQRLVDCEATKELIKDGLVDAAPAWGKQAALPAPSQNNPYATGRKSLVNAGEHALISSSLDSIGREASMASREASHDSLAGLGRLLSLSSSTEMVRPNSAAFGSRCERTCYVPPSLQARSQSALEKMERMGRTSPLTGWNPGDRSIIQQKIINKYIETGKEEAIVMTQSDERNSLPEPSKHEGGNKGQEGAKGSDQAGPTGRPPGPAPPDIRKIKNLDEVCCKPTPKPSGALVISKQSGPTKISVCPIADGIGQYMGSSSPTLSKLGFPSQAFAKLLNSITEERGTADGNARSIGPRPMSLGVNKKTASSASARPASAMGRFTSDSHSSVVFSTDLSPEAELEANDIKRVKVHQEILRMSKPLKGHNFEMGTPDNHLQSDVNDFVFDDSDKQRWGRPASAVRRMEVNQTVSTFDRNPAIIPRPSSAAQALRPSSALRSSPVIRPHSAMGHMNSHLTEVVEIQTQLVDETPQTSRFNQRYRRIASARSQRSHPEKIEYAMGLCNLSAPSEIMDKLISTKRPHTAPPSAKTSGNRMSIGSHQDIPRHQDMPTPISSLNDSISRLPSGREESLVDTKLSAAHVLEGTRMPAGFVQQLNMKLSKDMLEYQYQYQLATSSYLNVNELSDVGGGTRDVEVGGTFPRIRDETSDIETQEQWDIMHIDTDLRSVQSDILHTEALQLTAQDSFASSSPENLFFPEGDPALLTNLFFPEEDPELLTNPDERHLRQHLTAVVQTIGFGRQNSKFGSLGSDVAEGMEEIHQKLMRQGNQEQSHVLSEMEARLEQLNPLYEMQHLEHLQQHLPEHHSSLVPHSDNDQRPLRTGSAQSMSSPTSHRSAVSGGVCDREIYQQSNPKMSVTNFEFLGPNGNHPSHLVCGLNAQEKVKSNRKREMGMGPHGPIPYEMYKTVLAENIDVVRRMAQEGSRGVLKAKWQVSNKIADRHRPDNEEEGGVISQAKGWGNFFQISSMRRHFSLWQDVTIESSNTNAMKARYVTNRYDGMMREWRGRASGGRRAVCVYRAGGF